MYVPAFTEFCLLLSVIFNIGLIYGAYIFANPLSNKNMQIWSLTRRILERFNNQIEIQGKLPVSIDLNQYSKKLIESVKEKLLRKGYTVTTQSNVISIE